MKKIAAAVWVVLILNGAVSFSEEPSAGTSAQSSRSLGQDSKSRQWGVGIDLPLLGLGASGLYRISPEWLLELGFEGHGRGFTTRGYQGGGSPSAASPYGYEIELAQQDRVKLFASRDFRFGATKTWSIFGGLGLIHQTRQLETQFYNRWVGSFYDRNSPAGKSATTETQNFIAGQIGIRRDGSIFSDAISTAVSFDIPLSGYQPEGPETIDPSGNRVRVDKDLFQAPLKFTVQYLF